MQSITRRRFVASAASVGLATLGNPHSWAADPPDSPIRFGLVTYQCGRDWDLPTLLRNRRQPSLRSSGLPDGGLVEGVLAVG